MRRFGIAVLGLLCSACTATTPVYQYQGLKPATGAASEDGVFQDFSSDADTLARIWADPDATLHDGSSAAWANAAVNRASASPFLSVEFNRSGYGVSIELAPNQKTPEQIGTKTHLSVELRSSDAACVGVRFMEADGEVWAYGKAPLDYNRLCLSGKDEWQTFELPLAADNWFQFIYGGNTNLGNKTFDRDLIAMMSMELGLDGEHYFRPGEARLDIRKIRLISERS